MADDSFRPRVHLTRDSIGIDLCIHYSKFGKLFSRKLEAKFWDEKEKVFQNFFLGHTSWLKSSKMNFYGNPTTDHVTRLPYIALGNLPKIRKTLTYSNGRHHMWLETSCKPYRYSLNQNYFIGSTGAVMYSSQ